MIIESIDTSNMCSHLQKKLLEDEGADTGGEGSPQGHQKRKLKFAAIFGISWFTLLVLLVDGILKFQTLVDYFGSYALVEITLLLLVILPTVAVYIFTKG